MADFEDVKYQTDSGVVMLVKLDKTTTPQAGTPPSGVVQLPAHAIASRSRRTAGVHVRRMNLTREVGTAPNIFNKYRHVPLLTPAAYAAAALLVGTTVDIGSFTWKISSLSGEKPV